ncbi:hypothetical protein KCP74_01475 [Salmonella enterica subsp. enterica]|nr:hypothetical protein KCP74_01475 [Salmonella enterica subsp. enterica]
MHCPASVGIGTFITNKRRVLGFATFTLSLTLLPDGAGAYPAYGRLAVGRLIISGSCCRRECKTRPSGQRGGS